jgi:hypothetical protein
MVKPMAGSSTLMLIPSAISTSPSSEMRGRPAVT